MVAANCLFMSLLERLAKPETQAPSWSGSPIAITKTFTGISLRAINRAASSTLVASSINSKQDCRAISRMNACPLLARPMVAKETLTVDRMALSAAFVSGACRTYEKGKDGEEAPSS